MQMPHTNKSRLSQGQDNGEREQQHISPDLLLQAVRTAMQSLCDILPRQSDQQFSVPESGLGTLAPAAPAQKQLWELERKKSEEERERRGSYVPCIFSYSCMWPVFVQHVTVFLKMNN